MGKKEPKIKIFVAHHKPGYIYEDDVYVPIQVGKKNSKIDLGILGDDTGDNISEKNDNYAELTAQYWVWKNYDLSDVDYVGFCHYRRYMTYCYRPKLINYIFAKNPFGPLDTGRIPGLWKVKSRNEGNVFFDYDDVWLQNNSSNIQYYINDHEFDIYTVKREYYIVERILSIMNKEHVNKLDFCFGFGKRKKDLKKIFLDIFPDFEEIISEVERDCKRYYPLHRHLFIMKKDYFLQYEKWLFCYLFEVEKYMKKSCLYSNGIYGKNEGRFIGIFSEVLINYFLKYMEKKDGIKVSSRSNLIFFNN